MKRAAVIAGFLVLGSGCQALPKALQAPVVPEVKEARDPNIMDLKVDLNVSAGPAGRSLLFNGGAGATQQDIANLVVGIFENGTVLAANASFGYIISGNAGGATVSSTSTVGYLTIATEGITARLGSIVGAGGISADKANFRRYLIRDYGSGSSVTSGSTQVVFTKIPAVSSGAGTYHEYVIFAAAFDSAGINLGYTEANVAEASTTGAGPNAVAALTLALSQGVFTGNMTQTPTITTFVPTATLKMPIF